jgi:hypothetical protein
MRFRQLRKNAAWGLDEHCNRKKNESIRAGDLMRPKGLVINALGVARAIDAICITP